MKIYLFFILTLMIYKVHSQCTIPTFISLTDDFTTLSTGQNVTVSWNSDCPDALMNISLVKINPLPFQVVQQYTDIPNNGSFNFSINSDHILGLYQFYIQDIGTNIWTYGIPFNLTAPLPVTWSGPLRARIENKQILLNFSVESQINNSHFQVEHSYNGQVFFNIGRIAGQGNSSQKIDYEFIHADQALKLNYYRIKQMDYDGQYSYSNIASVNYDGYGQEIDIYPNPAIDEVTVNIIDDTEVTVMDMMGRVLKKQTISKGQNTINLSEFLSGFLIFVVGDKRYRVLKK